MAGSLAGAVGCFCVSCTSQYPGWQSRGEYGLGVLSSSSQGDRWTDGVRQAPISAVSPTLQLGVNKLTHVFINEFFGQLIKQFIPSSVHSFIHLFVGGSFSSYGFMAASWERAPAVLQPHVYG